MNSSFEDVFADPTTIMINESLAGSLVKLQTLSKIDKLSVLIPLKNLQLGWENKKFKIWNSIERYRIFIDKLREITWFNCNNRITKLIKYINIVNSR